MLIPFHGLIKIVNKQEQYSLIHVTSYWMIISNIQNFMSSLMISFLKPAALSETKTGNAERANGNKIMACNIHRIKSERYYISNVIYLYIMVV